MLRCRAAVISLTALLVPWLVDSISHGAPPEDSVALLNDKDLDGWGVRQANNYDWRVILPDGSYPPGPASRAAEWHPKG